MPNNQYSQTSIINLYMKLFVVNVCFPKYSYITKLMLLVAQTDSYTSFGYSFTFISLQDGLWLTVNWWKRNQVKVLKLMRLDETFLYYYIYIFFSCYKFKDLQVRYPNHLHLCWIHINSHICIPKKKMVDFAVWRIRYVRQNPNPHLCGLDDESDVQNPHLTFLSEFLLYI